MSLFYYNHPINFYKLSGWAKLHFYRYVLGHPAVHITIMGLRSAERFGRIALCLSDNIGLTDQEEMVLENYGYQMREQGQLD